MRSTPTLAARPTVRWAAPAAWSLLGYVAFVIVFGAVVRVTGSGAGCGQHWPTCHGELAHLPTTVETSIELTHRLTSGLSLLLMGALVVALRRSLPAGHLARRSSVAATFFLVVEAIIGAGLVLLELVADDASVGRAVMMSLHLVNTSLLTGALTICALAAGGSGARRWWPTGHGAACAGTTLLLLLVLVTGAVTALGDTLFPVREGARSALTGAHFLERVRWVHPIVATVGATLVVVAVAHATDFRRASASRRWGVGCCVAVAAQLAGGIANVGLGAPAWMQIVHLAQANVVWMTFVAFWATLASEAAATEGESTEGGVVSDPDPASPSTATAHPVG